MRDPQAHPVKKSRAPAPLSVPEPLAQEFATVKALWACEGSTRRVDALLLCWVKYEKQLRRLFCFLVFQHPAVDAAMLEELVDAMAANNNLYPETFIRGIEALKVVTAQTMVGDAHAYLVTELARIKTYRNKLMHGQITGKNIKSPRIERDVRLIVDWITALAAGADRTLGYDGLRRNTYHAAKATKLIAVEAYPFKTAEEFAQWLKRLAK